MSRTSSRSTFEGRATRQRILRAGVSRFQALGYHGAGVAVILAEARVPKGSFYHHFPGGKEQLAVEAVDWLAGEVDAFLERLAASGAGGVEMALEMAGYAASGLGRTESMRGSLIAVLAADAVPGSAVIGAALNRAIDGWVGRLAGGFGRAGVADAESRARVALAAIEGATVLARIGGRPAAVVELVAAALAS